MCLLAPHNIILLRILLQLEILNCRSNQVHVMIFTNVCLEIFNFSRILYLSEIDLTILAFAFIDIIIFFSEKHSEVRLTDRV